ncbi:hypothetical protein [Archangium lansingense]|uniref:Type VI lipoprotein IgE-like C-terminal domain-containing protein n=1 Tax=Archangium lansingense TaxID=2995310 RepID=A0ABT4AAK3_9BACT|nr:hypothetical protein [Archangium lansinium]MCY1078689.1 hypothetical protein [Archangium lansinium]
MKFHALLHPAALLPLLAACQPSTLQLNIKSPPGTNQGRPLYMLVRKVDAKQYAVESYGEVAPRVFQPDENVVMSELIYPGTIQRVKVKLPPESPLAVSFLFTAPDGTWQTFVNAPAPVSLDLELLEGRIRTGTAPAEPPKGPAADKPAEGAQQQ